MNTEYFKAVKPQALLRHWFTPEFERAYTFDYGVQLVFHNGGSEVAGKTIGSFTNYVESEAYAKEYLEFNHMIFLELFKNLTIWTIQVLILNTVLDQLRL